jgi:hypothetical protein
MVKLGIQLCVYRVDPFDYIGEKKWMECHIHHSNNIVTEIHWSMQEYKIIFFLIEHRDARYFESDEFSEHSYSYKAEYN